MYALKNIVLFATSLFFSIPISVSLITNEEFHFFIANPIIIDPLTECLIVLFTIKTDCFQNKNIRWVVVTDYHFVSK